MGVVYLITDPLRLSEVKKPSTTEMKEYLDLCIMLANDFSYEHCLVYQQKAISPFNQKPCYDPLSLGKECAEVIGEYLSYAEIPISEHDQEYLKRAQAKPGLSIEEFICRFENEYLKDALRIYTVCRILGAIHRYHSQLEEYLHCMVSAHDMACLSPLYHHYSLHAFDTTGYSNSRTVSNRLNYGYSMADSALWDLKQTHRYHMELSLLHDKYAEFGQEELSKLLHGVYSDASVTPDIHPVVDPTLAKRLEHIVRENHRLYRRLGPIAKISYAAMKPHRIDYKFLESMQDGIKIWHDSVFYRKHHKNIERMLKLFDLVDRTILYESILPDACYAKIPVFNLPGFNGAISGDRWLIGPSLRYTKDDDILKRIWRDGLRVEIKDGEVIMHPAEESTIDSPWYVDRLQREFASRGQSYIYEDCKNTERPWNPPSYLWKQLAAETQNEAS